MSKQLVTSDSIVEIKRLGSKIHLIGKKMEGAKKAGLPEKYEIYHNQLKEAKTELDHQYDEFSKNYLVND